MKNFKQIYSDFHESCVQAKPFDDLAKHEGQTHMPSDQNNGVQIIRF